MSMLSPRLQLKVAQKQILTPGLVQMVTVLQLNRLELKEMINQEIVNNPVLEESADSGQGTSDPLDIPVVKGLLLRDPAVGFVQACTPTELPEDHPRLKDDTTHGWIYTPEPGATQAAPCPLPSIEYTDISPNTDESTRVALSLPQFGRVHIYSARSELFENNNLVVTLAADGSLQTISSHDLSTAAPTGLTGLSAAATAAASAQTAHNTAVGAASTATVNNLQMPDTVNKALADCWTQRAAVIAAGGTPVDCQSLPAK